MVVAGSRRLIAATCTRHGGARGFTNLIVSKRDGEIELDAHATGGCVLRLDEGAARSMCETVLGWLG
jgi:hypothetical protein